MCSPGLIAPVFQRANMRPKQIIIVGGGTAGWMCANLLAAKWASTGTQITLVESSSIGTLGVGEGSTPFLRTFFAQLNISEEQWMPACDATYKCGITFPNWCSEQANNSYFHPFYSEIDSQLVTDFFSACNQRREGFDCDSHPDHYFVTAYVAQQNKAPKLAQDAQSDIDYAYHFDATKLGLFLKNHGLSLGVKCIDDEVTKVNSGPLGIEALETTQNGILYADFFIDCSGFSGLLIQQTLGEQLIDYSGYLPNNRAVAIQSENAENSVLKSFTLSKGLKHGWRWSIPLQSRTGNGYVYCSDFVSEQAAEQELREEINDFESKALHLHWTPGRINQHWKQNCLAVGLSQGFLEPLEAPMLNIAQQTCEAFIEFVETLTNAEQSRQQFNLLINNMIDGTRDYLQAHYKLNSRTDTPYWVFNRENRVQSAALKDILSAWSISGVFEHSLARHQQLLTYKKTSWYCILAGMHHYSAPTKGALRLTRKKRQRAQQQCQQLAAQFIDQACYLAPKTISHL